MYLDAHWAVGGLRPGHKIPKKLNPGPSWGPVGSVDVIPAEFRGKVHDTGSRIQALGGKIGTVSTNLAEIIESWISGVGPFVGICPRRSAVIWEQLDHTASPLSRYFMSAVILLTQANEISPCFVGFDPQKAELLLAFSLSEC